MALQILKFFQRKRNKSYSKDPYFLCHKTIWNGIEFAKFSIWACKDFQTTTIVKFATKGHELVMATVKIVYILNSILNRHQWTFVHQPFNHQDKFIREKDSIEGYDITQCIMSIKAFWCYRKFWFTFRYWPPPFSKVECLLLMRTSWAFMN